MRLSKTIGVVSVFVLLAADWSCVSTFAQTGTEKIFPYQGESVVTRELTDETQVFFQAMRLNRALNVWNVEVTISNKSSEVLSAPLFLSVESFTNTPGPINPDGSFFYVFDQAL